MATFAVKIGPLADLKEVELDSENIWAVRDVARLAGITLGVDQRLRIGRTNASFDDLVTESCTILIGEKIDAPISSVDLVVRIGPVGNAERIVLDGTRSWTVVDVIVAAKLTLKKGHKLLVDQEDIARNLAFPITTNCRIMLAEPIKAN